MNNNKILLFSFIIFSFFILKLNLEPYLSLIDVKGRAELLVMKSNDKGLKKISSIPITETKVFAIHGKIKANPGDITIPFNSFFGKELTTFTNSEGFFYFRLRPGTYTFFILQDNKAYLNSFDGYGYYKSNHLITNMDDLVITVTSNTLF